MQATATGVVVIIDVDDEPPKFSSSFYDAGVNEAMGSVVTTADVDVITDITVIDPDTTLFTFSIVNPSMTNGWFDIDPASVSQ